MKRGFMLCVFVAICGSAAGADLSVSLAGFPSDRGIARVSLYTSEQGFPDDPRFAFRASTASIRDRHAAIVFEHIPEGVYAVSAYHDENGNHRLDKKFGALPSEAVGASGYGGEMRGKPVFSKASFRVDAPACSISLVLFILKP